MGALLPLAPQYFSFVLSSNDAPLSHSDPIVPVLLALLVLTLAAIIGGRLLTWVGQPAVLGELLAGLLLGNLGYLAALPGITVLREGDTLRKIADLALSTSVTLSQAALQLLPAGAHGERIAAILAGRNGIEYMTIYSFVDLLSRIAVLVLLFLAGLETSLADMKRVGRIAFYVAIIGVILPMAMGLGAMKLLHPNSLLASDLFIGGILTATSVGITARVLRDLGHESRDEARVILGAAVLDDVLSLIILAVVSGLAITGTISAWRISWITAKAAIFLVGSLSLGIWITPAVVRRLARSKIHNVKLLAGCLFAFFLAWLADKAGLATIVGAFAAGMILNHFFDKELEGQSLRVILAPVESLVVPLFFVWIGIQVKLEALADWHVLIAGLALTIVGIVGKVASGVVCPKTMNRLAVGVGMMPRGEVGLIFAGIGKSIGVVDDGLFSGVIFLVLITTLLTPPALRWTLLDRPS
jgi:Kef-type K+ transport system membrane component KefB